MKMGEYDNEQFPIIQVSQKYRRICHTMVSYYHLEKPNSHFVNNYHVVASNAVNTFLFI
jgi:hypothetical protein